MDVITVLKDQKRFTKRRTVANLAIIRRYAGRKSAEQNQCEKGNICVYVPLTDIMVRLSARLITGIKGYAPRPITQHFPIAEQKSCQ